MKRYLDVKVSGFRSLRNCSFRINEGLNVLVGPNGSGKTNVAALLDFVSTFISSGLYAALAGAGGAVRVFSFESVQAGDDLPARMSLSISGKLGATKFSSAIQTLANVRGMLDDSEGKAPRRQIEFDYHLSLILDKKKFAVSIGEESLSWAIREGGKLGGLERVSASAIHKNDVSCSMEISEGSIDPRFEKVFSSHLVEVMLKAGVGSGGAKSIVDTLYTNAKDGQSLFQSITPFMVPDTVEIRGALSFDRSSNIIPDRVREPQDIASSGIIKGTGEGVISKLYKLYASIPDSKKKRGAPDTDYGRILTSFYKINEHINTINISPNLRTGKLDAEVVVGDGADIITVPFSWVSDGTAKWLAMLTLIRIRQSSYCIEEPENYIHPAAQRLFISILRDVSETKQHPFFLINTHSETIVNELAPSELLVCEYRRGTRIRRLRDPTAVREAINETGFGLGHLYANQRV